MTRQPAKPATTYSFGPEEARRFLVQGLGLACLATGNAAGVRNAMELAKSLIAESVPLPPLGVLADFHSVLAGDCATVRKDATPLMRRYADMVLGRLTADPLVERASAALKRYTATERPRGIAFLVQQILMRLAPGGVEIPASSLRLLEREPLETLQDADEPMPELQVLMEQLIHSVRRTAEVVAMDDVVAIEQRTALGDLAQFVAHREILQQAARLDATLPSRPLPPLANRREVPTRIHDSDQYPVGGYSSIGTRGSLESLLHSQLAYMEPGGGPDLFDARFVRDELFYYTRDENQFQRRRRAFAFHFHADLVRSRVKDVALPAQRIVLAMALVLSTIRRLADWLSHDALAFHVTFDEALTPERTLFAILLQEMRSRKLASVEVADLETIHSQWPRLANEAQLCAVVIADAPPLQAGRTHLSVAAMPILTHEAPFEGDWAATLQHLLRLWI